MVERVAGLEAIAGWFPDLRVMATAISPTRAVAIASTIPDDAVRELTFAIGDDTQMRVLARDPDRDLVLLETSLRKIPESFGPGVYTFVREGAGVAIAPTSILAWDTVTMGPREGIPGAPIVAEGKLFGIVHGYIGEGSWRCIPASELTEWRIPEDESFDGDVFFSRLTPEVVRAFRYAAGAAGGGPVEMTHLLFGLYEDYAGTTRRLFRARDVAAPSFAAEPVPLTALPPVDDDVQLALEEAMRIANTRGESDIRGRHLLYGALSVRPLPGVTAGDVQLDDPRPVLGHRADTIDDEDLLDISREARVLAGVLGADTVEPPISLGLFGEWGSGKSFFMRQMEREFAGIEGKSGYCHNIVQIWFNAWHYIDTPNLWASLAAEIFERLDFELSVREGTRPRDEAAHERAGALAQSAKARSELASITAERSQIESQLHDVESGLAALQDEGVIARSIGLRSVFTTAVEAASTDDKAKTEIQEIGKRITEAREKLQLSERSVAELRETTERGRAIAIAAKKMPLVSWLVVILFAILVVFGAAFAERVSDAVRALAGIAGVLAAPLAALLTPGGRAAATLFNAWRLKERLIEKERAKQAKPLMAEQVRLGETLAAKKEEEEQKTKELEQSEQRVAELEPKRRMSNFVAERKKSTDYTRHLGVIASAHDDFAELSRLLKRAAAENDAKSGVPPVDRIVLYIDDLDRCPEDKVVDVLQAVHLLLAFPLFIVVVGVDSRWLLHSLQLHLKQYNPSTPLNYLEKIFQIPFTIRRMRSGAFGELIENLIRPQDEVARERRLEKPKALTPSPAPERIATTTNAPVPAPESQKVGPASEVPPLPKPPTDYLTLDKWEREDMKAMYPLIPSPRAAKRFVNTYRLLRGMIDEYDRLAFIGTGDDLSPGGYRAALLMLAMLTGYPEETTRILEELITTQLPNPSWWNFVTPLITHDELRAHLNAIQQELPVVPPTSVFARWAPDVARFSFHSGRMAAVRT